MRNKKLISRRNDITQGWQFCSPLISLWKRKGEKEKKLSQHRVIVVGHPSKYYMGRPGLNFVERTEPRCCPCGIETTRTRPQLPHGVKR